MSCPPGRERLKHLLYRSLAAGAMTRPGLETLLADARRRNRETGVSGVLLHHEGQFLQCLEGPRAAVDATFARIRADRRHYAVCVLLERWVDRRVFAGRHMACTAVDALSWLQIATVDTG